MNMKNRSVLFFVSALLLVSLFLLVSCESQGDPLPTGGETTEAVTTSAPQTAFVPVMPSVPSNEEARRIAVDAMKEMSEVEWVAQRTMDYTKVVSFTSSLIYEEGKTYFGLPYVGLKPANAGLFRSCLDENKVYTGSIAWGNVPGNVCGSAIQIAFTTVSPDADNASGTWEFFPSAGKNMVAVGEYGLDTVKDPEKALTTDVVRANGQYKIAEAYACLRPGDVILSRWSGGGSVLGHVRMVSKDPVVVRSDNGNINIRSSALVVSEQCSGFDPEAKGKNTTWRIDRSYTFNDLLGAGYIPLALKDLAEDALVPPQIEVKALTKPEKITSNNMLKGTVYSNYVILGADAAITDEGGNTVASIHRTSSFEKTMQLTEVHFDNDVTSLPAGNYRFRLTVSVGFGEAVLADYAFEVK